MNQAMDMMGGLVLGIEVKSRRGAATVADAVNARNLRLVVRISRQPWRKVTHLWRDLRRRARATLSAIRTLTNCGSNRPCSSFTQRTNCFAFYFSLYIPKQVNIF